MAWGMVRAPSASRQIGLQPWDWVIRNNIIRNAGTGMYLGNSPGNNPFVRGIIEYNLFEDTIGYNMQIKHQNPRPTNIGMPTGLSKTIIRHNVFSKSGNSIGSSPPPESARGTFSPLRPRRRRRLRNLWEFLLSEPDGSTLSGRRERRSLQQPLFHLNRKCD